MHGARVAIVGGGLSGLYAAFLLEQLGITEYILLEARPQFGGRIVSTPSAEASTDSDGAVDDTGDRFDLGPAWFWPVWQPDLDRLVHHLNLERFEQYLSGDAIVERSRQEAPMRMWGYASAPTAMRLAGGMGALAGALQRSVSETSLLADQQVRRIQRSETHVELDAEDAHGNISTYRVEHVLLAVPPRLAVGSIDFMPPLPDPLAREWQNTATWMASHAKYVAIYDAPFWRKHRLSGQGRSAVGPLIEIHDASIPNGSAALFGFFGVPARTRMRVSEEDLRMLCRAQLARMFGPEATTPRGELIKDWAADPLTATAADRDAVGEHGPVPAAAAASGTWHDCLTGIASEWSPQFAGYVAGAIEAADFGVRRAISIGRLNRAAPGHAGTR